MALFTVGEAAHALQTTTVFQFLQEHIQGLNKLSTEKEIQTSPTSTGDKETNTQIIRKLPAKVNSSQ